MFIVRVPSLFSSPRLGRDISPRRELDRFKPGWIYEYSAPNGANAT
jgi:hypothetical protein